MIIVKAGTMIRSGTANDVIHNVMLIPFERVDSLEASGYELRAILDSIGGIPYPKNLGPLEVPDENFYFEWRGNDAQTIFANLELIF